MTIHCALTYRSLIPNKLILNFNKTNFTKFVNNKSKTIMHVSCYNQYIQNNYVHTDNHVNLKSHTERTVCQPHTSFTIKVFFIYGKEERTTKHCNIHRAQHMLAQFTSQKNSVNQKLLHLRNNAHLHHFKLHAPLYLVSCEVSDLQFCPSKCKMCEKTQFTVQYLWIKRRGQEGVILMNYSKIFYLLQTSR